MSLQVKWLAKLDIARMPTCRLGYSGVYAHADVHVYIPYRHYYVHLCDFLGVHIMNFDDAFNE